VNSHFDLQILPNHAFPLFYVTENRRDTLKKWLFLRFTVMVTVPYSYIAKSEMASRYTQVIAAFTKIKLEL